MNDKFDKTLLYWKHIDQNARSITLNLRPLFLNLDITIIRNESLKKIVAFMKSKLGRVTLSKLPDYLIKWIPPKDLPYIIIDEQPNAARLEFLFYRKLAHHIETNQLTLEFSIKHKDVENNLIKRPQWKRDKPKLLRSLPYPQLRENPNILLDRKEQLLTQLYQKTNFDIRNGKNQDIILKNNKYGKEVWRLKPLEPAADPNERLFANFPKQSIVSVMRFVEDKTRFSRGLKSILPRSNKKDFDFALTSAVILANALRIGSRGIANVCNLEQSDLLHAEKTYVRMETLTEILHIINVAFSQCVLPRC